MPPELELEPEVSAEEKEAEEQGLATVEADKVRETLASDLGIDPEEGSDLLDKLVEREAVSRERLSKTIKQKISWREKAKGSKKPEGVKKPEGGIKPVGTPDVQELVNQGINAALEARDLKSLKLSEEIEAEVKELAKLRSIPVGEAANLPYIQSRIEEEVRAERISKASPKRTNKGTYKSSVDPSKPLDPEDFDLNSEEGRSAWKASKKARENYEKNK